MAEVDDKISTEVANAEPTATNLEKALTPRQAAFVNEYLLDLNGTQAAIRAGYSPHTARSIAVEYLAKPDIAAAVARARAQRLSRVNLSADTILQEMSALALSNIKHYKITDEGEVELAEGAPPNAMAAIAAIDRTTTEKVDPKSGEITRTYNVKLKLWDKPNPLKLLGKHAGIQSFVDRVEVTGKNGGPIEVAAVRLTELSLEQLKQKMLQLVEQAPIEAVEAEVLEKAS
jgi:phage terminase small subunit